MSSHSRLGSLSDRAAWQKEKPLYDDTSRGRGTSSEYTIRPEVTVTQEYISPDPAEYYTPRCSSRTVPVPQSSRGTGEPIYVPSSASYSRPETSRRYYPPSTRPYAASYSSGPSKRSSSQYCDKDPSSYDYDDRRGYDNRHARPSDKPRYKENRGRDYAEQPSQPRERGRERSRSSLRPRNPTGPSYGMDPRNDFTPRRKRAKTLPSRLPTPNSTSTKKAQYDLHYDDEARTHLSSSSRPPNYEPDPKDPRAQTYTYMSSRRPQNSSSHPQDRINPTNVPSDHPAYKHESDRQRASQSEEKPTNTNTSTNSNDKKNNNNKSNKKQNSSTNANHNNNTDNNNSNKTSTSTSTSDIPWSDVKPIYESDADETTQTATQHSLLIYDCLSQAKRKSTGTRQSEGGLPTFPGFAVTEFRYLNV
ncbi:hypothetical protein V8F33_003852 [Rhypophila sp. PSN 637]